MARGRNKTQRVPEMRQSSLLDVPEAPSQRSVVSAVRFDLGDRGRLFVGGLPLWKYLEKAQLRWVLRLAELLEQLDWSAFESAHKGGGRPPLHPKLVVGLIMYGLLLKQSSLRQLETLALRDVGAWWLTAGLTPDHTTITKFIRRHQQLLSEDFFIQVTSHVAKHLGIGASELVLDGTVVQAAASTSQTLMREALEEKLKDAEEAGETQRIEQLARAEAALAAREATRDAAGRDPALAQVSPTEPEAVLQPLKNSDDHRLGYKPVIGAHPSGLIVGQALSPSNENACVGELLTQHGQVFGAAPASALADAGFCTIENVGLFLLLNIDALIPSGRSNSEGMKRKTSTRRFPKAAFTYDEASMTAQCPAGHTMGGDKWLTDRGGRRYRELRTPACRQCPLHDQCTAGRSRILKRYEGEELKEAMAAVLAQPRAREAYARRAGIVEPAIARLRQAGLSRFTRRGTAGARLEFALRCTSHNLSLLLHGRRSGLVVLLGFIRLPDGEWRLAAVAVASTRR
jgi:hypothetical protein